MKLYQERIMDYYRRAPFRGSLSHPTFSSGMINPSCGDVISIEGIVEDGRLVAASFQGKGCIISQAAASIVLESAVGKPITEIMELITPGSMKELVGLALGPMRAKCAELAAEALKKGIAEYHAQSR